MSKPSGRLVTREGFGIGQLADLAPGRLVNRGGHIHGNNDMFVA
jgi:hypothetical protein